MSKKVKRIKIKCSEVIEGDLIIVKPTKDGIEEKLYGVVTKLENRPAGYIRCFLKSYNEIEEPGVICDIKDSSICTEPFYVDLIDSYDIYVTRITK